MKIMEVAKLIFLYNIEVIRQRIASSFVNSIPSEFIEFKIQIDLIGLCETHPSLAHTLIGDFLFFKEAIRKLIKEEIKEKYTEEKIEQAQMVNFQDLFEVLIELSNIPILTLQTEIKDTHRTLKADYALEMKDLNICTGEKTFEVVSSLKVPLSTLRGELSEQPFQLEKKSNFYQCRNTNCSDKTYVLRLRNISYVFKDSKRSFTFGTNSLRSTCFNCMTPPRRSH